MNSTILWLWVVGKEMYINVWQDNAQAIIRLPHTNKHSKRLNLALLLCLWLLHYPMLPKFRRLGVRTHSIINNLMEPTNCECLPLFSKFYQEPHFVGLGPIFNDSYTHPSFAELQVHLLWANAHFLQPVIRLGPFIINI